ncbi:hypothetical protein [Phenylobacterium sp.]|jgi:hypothetical protein|nr:hypothetical protein [Phenylobacterium sp.]
MSSLPAPLALAVNLIDRSGSIFLLSLALVAAIGNLILILP